MSSASSHDPCVVLQRSHFAPRSGFAVTVHREPDQSDSAFQHRHDFYEIVWILEGKGVHVTGDFRHRVVKGEVLVLDPCRMHGYEQTEGLNLINVLLDPGLFPSWNRAFSSLSGFQRLFVLAGDHLDQAGYQSRVRLAGKDAEDLSEWIDRIEVETHSASPEAPALAESWVFQLVGLLSRRGEELVAGPPSTVRPYPTGVNRVLTWIELHLEEPLRVEDLACEAGMSVRTFQRSFQRRTGLKPMQYLHSRRMMRAERLLKGERGIRISEVGRRCGYENPSYFSIAVRKTFGRSPREIRGE